MIIKILKPFFNHTLKMPCSFFRILILYIAWVPVLRGRVHKPVLGTCIGYLGTSMVRPQPYPNPTSCTRYFMYENMVLAWILVCRATCLGTWTIYLSSSFEVNQFSNFEVQN